MRDSRAVSKAKRVRSSETSRGAGQARAFPVTGASAWLGGQRRDCEGLRT